MHRRGPLLALSLMSSAIVQAAVARSGRSWARAVRSPPRTRPIVKASPKDLTSAASTYIRVEIAVNGGPESWSNPRTPTSGARRLAGRWSASSVCRAAICLEARAPFARLTDAYAMSALGLGPTRTKGRQDVTKDCLLGSHSLVGIVTLSAAFSYLTAAPEAVENFRHVGYPSSCVSCSASRSWPEPSCCSYHGCRP